MDLLLHSLAWPSSTRGSHFPSRCRLSSRAAVVQPSNGRSIRACRFKSSCSAACSAALRWVVVTEKPPVAGGGALSRSEVVDYYVDTLARVLGSKEEAQLSIYDASLEASFGFRCEIDEESSQELARVPGVQSVRPDNNTELEKDGSNRHNSEVSSDNVPSRTQSGGNNEYWLVRVEKPGVEVVSKSQMVDYYTEILTKVLGNEKDAQACMYNTSWQRDFSFCCQIDADCANQLADVPGVISVFPDMSYGSDNEVNKGGGDLAGSSDGSQSHDVKTKRLFVTGLSFYTSEKTLREAFEPFGELVEVKIIMDKISKRSKGYAFLEYTTVEAAGAALQEMNGKIINGWMIVVDVARSNPTRSASRARPQPTIPLT